MAPEKLRVAICGGGIGGLSLALMLDKFSAGKKEIQVDVYEAKDCFAEVGAGMSVWKRTWSILRLLGLEGALADIAINPPAEEPTPGFTFRRADQPEGGYDFYRIVSPFGFATVHRADMLKILTDNLPKSVGTHFSKRLINYVQTSSGLVTMSFSDGTTAEADILVGAEGMKSVTREVMYKDLAAAATLYDETEAQKLEGFIQPTWMGVHAYRALIDTEKLLEIAPGHQITTKPIIHFGKSKHLVAYPISKGRFINFVSLVSFPEEMGSKLDGPTMIEVPVEEMAKHHEGWEPQVQQMIRCVDKCTRWSVCQNRDLPHFVSGHVAILGDAAHSMSPNLGAGAGQAIEDAHVLGRILADDSVTAENVQFALSIYDAVRRPLSNKVADYSRLCGDCYDFNYIPENVREAGVDIMSPEGLKLLSESAYAMWSHHWTGLPENEWLEAERMLKDSQSAQLGESETVSRL